ncbi:hypothetical protein ACB092_05G063800, partial [Castanea dentata]
MRDSFMIVNHEGQSENLLGMVVNSEEEAYKLYNEYAMQTGFKYVCSKEGFSRDKNPCEIKKVNKLETRTGCKASIKFTIENGEWKVTSFNSKRNHELAKAEQRQFLRSNRKITDAYVGVIKTFKEAGIRTINAYSYLAEESGGFANIGFTRRDCYYLVNKEKLKTVEVGDAQSLVNHFKKRQAEDPLFFYAIQVDQENRMTNFFWRDGRSRIDYDSFGDVTFIESMGNQKPKMIFTDQRQAMINAIKLSRFNKILYGCETEAEFNSCWDGLITDYNLAGDKWLKSLYEICEKWCPVFSLNIFSAKMKASSRSESTNNVFHNMTFKTMSLTEFVLHYETTGKKMREEELEEDFRCNQGAPPKIVQHSGILRHAASIHTRKIFYLFELEFASTLGVKIEEVNHDGDLHTFALIEDYHQRVRTVQFNSLDNVVTCSCKMFESLGLLCRHALRVINDEKKDSASCKYATSSSMSKEMSVTLRRNELMRSIYDIFSKSAATTRHTEIEIATNGDGLMKSSHDDLPILDPPYVQQKGITNKRIKYNLEKCKRRAPKDVTRSKKVTKGKPSKNFDQTPQVASSCKHISTPMDVNSS